MEGRRSFHIFAGQEIPLGGGRDWVCSVETAEAADRSAERLLSQQVIGWVDIMATQEDGELMMIQRYTEGDLERIRHELGNLQGDENKL